MDNPEKLATYGTQDEEKLSILKSQIWNRMLKSQICITQVNTSQSKLEISVSAVFNIPFIFKTSVNHSMAMFKSQAIWFWYFYLQALLQTMYDCFLIEVRIIENLNCEGYNPDLKGME
jgi:hypothetical protein